MIQPFYHFQEITLIKDLKQNDFLISQFKENGFSGISAKRHVSKNVDIWNYSSISKLNSEENINCSINKGFFSDVYKLNTSINFAGERDSTTDSDWISTMFLSKADLKLKLSMPIEAQQHNASMVNSIDKPGYHTYEWDILLNQNNVLLFEVKKYNLMNIILTILSGCALVILVFYFIRKQIPLTKS